MSCIIFAQYTLVYCSVKTISNCLPYFIWTDATVSLHLVFTSDCPPNLVWNSAHTSLKDFVYFLFHFILFYFIFFLGGGGVIIKCSRGNKIQNHFTIKTLKSVVAHPESFRPLNLSFMVISCAEIRQMCHAYIHFSCDKEMCPSYKIFIDFIFFFDWIIFYIQILTWHIKASWGSVLMLTFKALILVPVQLLSTSHAERLYVPVLLYL